jgi:hypothetical protein
MQFWKYLGVLMALSFMLSLAGFAKDKDMNSGQFDLDQTAKIGSTMLQPGHYKAEWSGPANAANVQILQNGKTVATTKGTVKELPQKAPYDAVTVNSQTHRVDEIDFSHRAEALIFRS